MKKINEFELKRIKGGFSIWAFISIIVFLAFGVGTVDGYVKTGICE